MNVVFNRRASYVRKDAALAGQLGVLVPFIAVTILLGCSSSSDGVSSDGVGGATGYSN